MSIKIKYGFLVIWSNNRWLLPTDKITKDGYFTIATNRFNHHTYRLKPYIKLIKS